MDYKQLYLSFDGRLGRKTYLLKCVLPIFVLQIILNLIGGAIDPNLGLLLTLPLLWPSLATGAKRCHDRNKSGWWQLILIIPIIGLIWWIVDLCVMKGDDGSNKFGAPEQA